MSRGRWAGTLLLVAIGGALGGMARYAVGVIWPADATSFPWGTLAINVLGAGLLALLPAFAAVRRRPILPAFLGSGVLGGFTTLSTFAEQSRALVAAGRPAQAASYVVLTLAAGLGAALLVRRLSTPAERLVFRDEEGEE